MKYIAAMLFYILGIPEFILRLVSVPATMFVTIIFLEDKIFDCFAWKLAEKCLE